MYCACKGICHITHVAVRGQACGTGSLFVFWRSNLGCQALMTSTSISVYRSSTKIFSMPYLSCSQPQEVSMPTAQRRKGAQGGNALNQWAEETSAQDFWLEPLWPLPITYSLCSYLDFPFYFIFLGCSANWQLPNSLNHAILFSFLLFLLTDLHYETQTCNQLVNLLPQPLSVNGHIIWWHHDICTKWAWQP